MPLPTASDLFSLDVAYLGEPFVRAASADTTTLDVAYLGEPFVAPSGGGGPVESDGSSALLPALIGDGATPGVVLNNTSSGVVPLLVPTANTGRVGPVGNSRDGDLTPQTLPVLSGTGAGGPAPALPALSGTGTAKVGPVGHSAQTLVALSGAAHGNPGVMGRSTLALPALAGNGATPLNSAAALPAIVAASSGTAGTIGRSAMDLPRLDGAAAGATPVVGTSQAALAALRAESSAASGAVGASSATLSALILAAEGVAGSVGHSTVTLPVLRATSDGHVQVVGDSTVTLPAIVSVSTAPTAAPVGQDYTGFALQTQAQALTTYSGVPFNALARFNGVYLASGPGGLFVLEGGTDDGALIDAAVRLGTTSFGSMQLKRVDAMYVNYRADGDLALKVIIDEHEEYDYTLVAHGHDTLTTERVKLGRGAKGTYWQFEITNLDGADFDFDRIEPREQALSRRLG